MRKPKPNLDSLLKANPKARKQEATVREAMRLIRRLRSQGFTDDGYELLPPFGEKTVTLQRRKASLAD